MRRCRRSQGRGFTLVELLVVISIVGLVLAVSLPVSYNMYQNYKISLRVEEVLIYVSQLRRESFLYGEEISLSSKDGRILQRDGAVGFADVFVQIDDPIKFYKNGTTSGGVLKLRAGNSSYLLKITSPFGDILLERET